MSRRSRELHHITRMNYEKVKGWMVRVVYKGELITKLFSDGVYKSEDAAKQAAIEFRDDILTALYGESHAGRPNYRETFSRNRSGVIGVTYQETPRQGGKYVSKAWVGYYNKDGKQHRKSFSVKVHGDLGAFQKAVEFREVGIGAPH